MRSQATTPARVRDARGRVVRQLDPVRLHLLGQASVIPPETLRSLSDRILPDARRQRAIVIGTAVATALFVVLGTAGYFLYAGRRWSPDRVSLAINTLQVLIILAGPVIAFRLARARYAGRIRAALLAARHCPHCGYNLRDLPPDPVDNATVCPECGCAWPIPSGGSRTA